MVLGERLYVAFSISLHAIIINKPYDIYSKNLLHSTSQPVFGCHELGKEIDTTFMFVL